MSISYDNLPTKEMPKGLQPTALQRASTEYAKQMKEGKINPDGTPKEVAAVNNKVNDARKEKDDIKNYLATKTDYNVMVDGEIKTYQRYDLNPQEHFALLDIIDFHNRMISELGSLDQRRVLLQAKLNILGRSLGTIENTEMYDQILQQIEALNTRYHKLTWNYNGKEFKSSIEFATYLYQKTLEYCLKMTEEEFNKSAFRSNMNLAKEHDVYGTRHIADACIDVELHSYSYFQTPSKSS